MRKLVLSFLISLATAGLSMAQLTTHVVTFDTLTLPKADTFYVNFSSPGNDVGFSDLDVYFPCVYDTGWGASFWSYGFVYSNMTDSVTSGYGNQYAAKTAKGVNNSNNYAVAYGTSNLVRWNQGSGAMRVWDGFYVTNSTYAYNSMRDGDGFAKKFGGATGDDPDWFKLTVRRYLSGQLQPDSVEFYLADFRDTNNANDYIINDWQWVGLGAVYTADSLLITLSSSDNDQFGMKTPAYFCLDDLSYKITPDHVNDAKHKFSAKVYPNPATDQLFVELNEDGINAVSLMDMSGRVLKVYQDVRENLSISVSELSKGMYLLQFDNGSQKQSVRFLKQ